MKRCVDCGAPCKPGKACSVDHMGLLWAKASIPVLYRVAAWMWEPPYSGLPAWEYVKPHGQDDDFFDIHRALLFAKRVLRRKSVAKVEVRIEMTVQSFQTGSIIRKGHK